MERIKHHLEQYASVSNAKFNQHTTEAFALDGSNNATWRQILNDNNISTYYHRESPTPFRYLGFTMCYTRAHRLLTVHQLIADVKKQVGIYSRRYLSIKGRATIWNSLILSKIWYTLRLFNAPKSLFTSLQSICSRFVGQGKYPPDIIPATMLACTKRWAGDHGRSDTAKKPTTTMDQRHSATTAISIFHSRHPYTSSVSRTPWISSFASTSTLA
ncbi:hypothetical protein BC941DRAFT_406379 [Chlamydoabsidia padenii]|nr:hypothetical protein BC941DRAFT_406379 [Chlamydoabsidia padenii]